MIFFFIFIHVIHFLSLRFYFSWYNVRDYSSLRQGQRYVPVHLDELLGKPGRVSKAQRRGVDRGDVFDPQTRRCLTSTANRLFIQRCLKLDVERFRGWKCCSGVDIGLDINWRLPIIQNKLAFVCACKMLFIAPNCNMFLHVCYRALSHAYGIVFMCDTIAALPELINRCQKQHMLLSYTTILYKPLSLNVLIRAEGSLQWGSCEPLQTTKTTDT